MERSIGYIRRSFYVPLISRYKQRGEPLALDTLNLEFARWLAVTANTREHGTTGEVPLERLEQERPALQPLPPSLLLGQPRSVDPGRSPTPLFKVEALQHPLSVYEDLREQA